MGAKDAKVGDTLPERSVDGLPDLEPVRGGQLRVRPIHMDDEAGAAGYPTAFGMGNLQWAFLHNMLREWIGDDGRIHRVAVQFRAPNTKGMTVTTHGTVTGVRDEGGKKYVDLEVLDRRPGRRQARAGDGDRRPQRLTGRRVADRTGAGTVREPRDALSVAVLYPVGLEPGRLPASAAGRPQSSATGATSTRHRPARPRRPGPGRRGPRAGVPGRRTHPRGPRRRRGLSRWTSRSTSRPWRRGCGGSRRTARASASCPRAGRDGGCPEQRGRRRRRRHRRVRHGPAAPGTSRAAPARRAPARPHVVGTADAPLAGLRMLVVGVGQLAAASSGSARRSTWTSGPSLARERPFPSTAPPVPRAGRRRVASCAAVRGRGRPRGRRDHPDLGSAGTARAGRRGRAGRHAAHGHAGERRQGLSRGRGRAGRRARRGPARRGGPRRHGRGAAAGRQPAGDLPGAYLSPHASTSPHGYDDRLLSLFAENLARYVDGRALVNAVDPARGY